MLNRVLAYTIGFAVLWLLLRLIRAPRTRQVVLLVASYLFYASWGSWFLGLLILSSIVNFAIGKLLQRRPSAGRLWIGIAFNLLLLGTFKYMPVVAANVEGHAGALDFFRHIVLPLGISFWTFEALGYLFDLYREEELDPTLLEFSLFLAFWPTVFAGPICRLGQMLPQFRAEAVARLDQLGLGLQRVLMGLFMMGLARVLQQGFSGYGLDAGFALAPARWSAIDVLGLAVGYGFQLFFDFAGYSHLVIGAAQACGFELPENFQKPYLSTSPSSFWTRWHMSLSFWIRDYLFLPLVMLRREGWWRHFTLFFSMVIFGLWHKASWTFLLWGAYQGLLLVIHRYWQQFRTRVGFVLPVVIDNFLGWAITFKLICLSWILFRSPTLGQAWSMLSVLFSPSAYMFHKLPKLLYMMVATAAIGYFATVGIAALLTGFAERSDSESSQGWDLLGRDRWLWVAPLAAVFSLYVFLVLHPEQSKVGPMLYRLF
jgi:D-alanyl-lipoteichoic acid acyltransferase DltB (MBOAT superfamily)